MYWVDEHYTWGDIQGEGEWGAASQGSAVRPEPPKARDGHGGCLAPPPPVVADRQSARVGWRRLTDGWWEGEEERPWLAEGRRGRDVRADNHLSRFSTPYSSYVLQGGGGAPIIPAFNAIFHLFQNLEKSAFSTFFSAFSFLVQICTTHLRGLFFPPEISQSFFPTVEKLSGTFV